MDLASLVAGATRLPGLREVLGDLTVEITGITHDSRAVTPGTLFCAVPGAVADGHRFATEAVRAGASAVMVEHPMDVAVAQLVVADTRAAMGPLAAALYQYPSHAMPVVAVTGTNGKTTTCHILATIFGRHGWPAATIGTLSGVRTTPEAPELQAQLASMRDRGVQAVAIEATSIGLDLHRVDGTEVAVAVFTNLSRDHLDVHGTMERYFAAKARLFEPGLSARAVVNGDDPYGRLLLDAAQIPTVTFSMDEITDLRLEPLRSRFRWRGHAVDLALGGRFNVSNALAAAVAAEQLGITMPTVVEALASLTPVPGRFEPIEAGQDFTVLVDYAHTPDGLDVALAAARQISPAGQVIVVFGCGGDRDVTKRGAMGEAAARGADVAIITSDNPRHEDPGAIISAVRTGIPSTSTARVEIEQDRRTAIGLALATAGPGDVVLVAGKGHETTQTIGDQVLAFDDRVVVRELLTGGDHR